MSERGQVMSLDVKAGANLETGPPKMLFQPVLRMSTICLGTYGVTANGQKFLVMESRLDEGRMHVVTDWESGLHR